MRVTPILEGLCRRSALDTKGRHDVDGGCEAGRRSHRSRAVAGGYERLAWQAPHAHRENVSMSNSQTLRRADEKPIGDASQVTAAAQNRSDDISGSAMSASDAGPPR